MRFHLNCRQASALLLQAQDRPLGMAERLTLRAHLLMCHACTRFSGQVRLMQRATSHWRHYRDHGDPGDDSGAG